MSQSTNYRQKLHGKILRTSMKEFMKKGIRAVKMDDIAGILAISKRTLYEVYLNKEELLLECVKLYEEDYDNYIEQFSKIPGHNVMDVIIEFYNKRIEWLSGINPVYVEDLQKFSHVVELLEQRETARADVKLQFFKRGVEEGFFRSDVDFDIVSRIVNSSMEYVISSGMYKEYDMAYLLHNVVLMFIRGICTKKGIEKIDGVLGL